ncbi:thioredoxin [Pelolinea submarina]|jgi:putative thioredoxin|uniref:Thioredoxin n=1 Tax=Pelolinea submarina TaxID=913107 RepID=A0A347ZW46_9CHLR|nr:thioredoxin [Pelolinea submarina]REG07222.1 thioredoxin [Pelolinea submarina]BBB49527.1 thioredoxin [Pelolinea submarina]
MNATDHVINVNELNFEYEVVAYSQNIPVLVDFWAEWCKPCQVLGPTLEKIVNEANGGLRLAKVNIDQNPNLATQYNVRSIPTVKAFINGQVVAEFVGMQPESRLREFISNLTPPSPLELDIKKGQGLLLGQNWSEAESVLRAALEQKPDSLPIQLALAKALLAQNQAEEAKSLLDEIPSGREYAQAEILIPYAQSLLDAQHDLLPDESTLDAIFKNSLRLAGQGKFPIALDGLLDILREDKRYQNGRVRQIILAILEIMGEEDPQTRDYRAELNSVLF